MKQSADSHLQFRDDDGESLRHFCVSVNIFFEADLKLFYCNTLNKYDLHLDYRNLASASLLVPVFCQYDSLITEIDVLGNSLFILMSVGNNNEQLAWPCLKV